MQSSFGCYSFSSNFFLNSISKLLQNFFNQFFHSNSNIIILLQRKYIQYTFTKRKYIIHMQHTMHCTFFIVQKKNSKINAIIHINELLLFESHHCRRCLFHLFLKPFSCSQTSNTTK